MINGFTVRRADINDIDVINRLLYQVAEIHAKARPDLFRHGAKKYSDEEIREIIEDDSRPVFVGCIDGKTVCYAFCIVNIYDGTGLQNKFKTLYIDDLCVDENYRGCGAGTRMFEYLKDYAGKTGFYNIVLNVWEANRDAVKFYEKLGMTTQSEHKEIIL